MTDKERKRLCETKATLAQSNAEQELSDIAVAIGSTRFMDPPDGGNVSLAEQVTRMRKALEKAEAALAQSDAWRRGT
jgi:hypothetical protein